jgi:hypothetical protein
VDGLCDRIVRQPLEDADLSVFEELEPGDMLFVDGSHRALQNSDATVVFLEILPELEPDIWVGFHDIFLPDDYPDDLADDYYSEQYLLAAYLLAGGGKLDVLLPATFVTREPELAAVLDPLWRDPAMEGVETHGVSFWIRTQ